MDMEVIPMKIGTNIKKCRTAQGLTQEQLAKKLYITRQTVSSWERSASNPDLEQLEAIAGALGVDMMTLLYGPQKPSRFRRRQVVGVAGLILLLVLWVANSWLEPWVESLTKTYLFYYLYYYHYYYDALLSAIGGVTVLALLDPWQGLALKKRDRRICLAVGLVLLALLVLGPVCILGVGRAGGPQWLAQLFGRFFLHTYRKITWPLMGMVFGACAFLVFRPDPEGEAPKGREAAQP